MAQQAEVFPAGPTARRAISRTAYMLFGTGAALIGCSATALAITVAVQEAPSSIFLTVITAVGCVGGVGLMYGIVNLARLRQPIHIEVTPHRLIWREGNSAVALEFDEVVRVELLRASKKAAPDFVMSYPVIRFIENDGEMMEFEISFEDRGYVHHGRFDVQAVTRAVLPHLPGNAVISPAVDTYVKTGMIDIDMLPEQ